MSWLSQHRLARRSERREIQLLQALSRTGLIGHITPPSEVRRPPSKAAVTFLRPTAGNQNGSIVSSCMAGVAGYDRVNGLVSTPNPKTQSALYATPASESQPCL